MAGEGKVIAALQSAGIWADRRNSGGNQRIRLCERGTPDIWTPRGYIEGKAPGDRLNPSQIAWHARARVHGVRVATVNYDSPGEAIEIVSGWESEVCACCKR